MYRILTETKVEEPVKKVKLIQDEITSDSLRLVNMMAEQSKQEPREELECPVCCEKLGAPRRNFQCSQHLYTVFTVCVCAMPRNGSQGQLVCSLAPNLISIAKQ